MIDVHSHILPGIDDGSSSWEETFQLLSAAQKAGVKTLFATPHIYYYQQASKIFSKASQKLDELKGKAQEQGINISLYLGFEVLLQPELPALKDLNQLTLGQAGQFILTELASGPIPNFVEKTCFDLLLNGTTPILAHPERNLISSSQLERLKKISQQGVYLQIEASSLIGNNGKPLRKACQLLLEEGVVSLVASDAHNQKRSFEPMAEAYQMISKRFGEDKAQEFFYLKAQKIIPQGAVQTGLNLAPNKA